MSNVLTRTIRTPTHGRYLLRAAAGPAPHPLLVGFHGYGENAERHLDELEKIPGIARWSVASVQGLHRFYRARTDDVVASWMTRQDRELAIADNIEYVNRVVADIYTVHAVSQLVYVGFSQGTAMAFRAAVAGAVPCSGIIALGGDIPPELKGGPSPGFPKILVARGTRDGWYTSDKLQADLEFLRSTGADAQSMTFAGGHEWTEPFRAAVSAFLQSVQAFPPVPRTPVGQD